MFDRTETPEETLDFGEHMSDQPKSDSSETMLKAARDGALLFGVYAYFVGWVYIFYYYESFDVSLNRLEVPPYYFIVYSFSGFYNFWGIFILISATFLLLLLIMRIRPLRFLAFLVLLMLFPILFRHARNVAIEDAYAERFSDDADRVLLSFRGDATRSYPSDLITNNDAMRLRFLTETSNSVIVFYQPRPEQGAVSFLLVYEISKQDLVVVKKLVADVR